MARFSIGACAMASKMSANEFTLSFSLLFLSNPMAQPLGGRNPNVVSVEVYSKYVVVRGRGRYWYRRYLALGVAHRHLRRSVFQRRAINGPVHAVVVSQSLVRSEP